MITTGVDTMKGLASISLASVVLVLATVAYWAACMAAYKAGGLAFWILYTAMFA